MHLYLDFYSEINQAPTLYITNSVFYSKQLKMKPLYSFFLAFFAINVAQSQTLNISPSQLYVDEELSLVVCHLYNIEDYSDLSAYEELDLIFNHEVYGFDAMPDSLSYKAAYLVNNNSTQYQLYFTSLPLISINSDTNIPDEPKVAAFLNYDDEHKQFNSIIGIEVRGGSSQSYPKKSYDLELWQDATGEESHSESFGDMRSDDDWILNGLYNEPLRMRNFINHKLWLDIHQVHYQEQEEEAKAGADVEYVEMFLNGKYNGVYLLTEQIDRKLLKLKHYENNTIQGELYKAISWGGAPTFDALLPFDNNDRLWNAYSYKYPKVSEITDWQYIYDFIDFVMNSDDQSFTDEVWSRFEQNNFIDYFLFLNMIAAGDNTGKNIYLAKYDQNHPYFYTPWDMDGSLGNTWQGLPTNYPYGIYSNKFYDRVFELNPGGFKTKVRNRWNELRDNIFNTQNLRNRVLAPYNYLTDNKVYEREAMIYPTHPFSESDKNYLVNWLNSRLLYLDSEIHDITPIDHIHQENTLSLYPNPSKNTVFLKVVDAIKADEVYQIYNELGQKIQTAQLDNLSIDISTLPNGFYFLKLKGELLKFVKMN